MPNTTQNYKCSLSNKTFSKNFTCGTYLHYVVEAKQLENYLFQYWIIIAAVYIILMQLGFVLLETG